MGKRVQIGEQTKGSLTHKDWWYLVLEDDGSDHVEHQWSHGKGVPNTGSKRFSVEEFLAGDGSEGFKSELRFALRKNGRTDA
jgi:hypothetical protein